MASKSLVAAVVAVVIVVILAPPAGAAPTWLAPGNLGAEVTGTSSIGQIAVAPNGTVVAAWKQATSNGSSFVVQVRRRLPGGSFGAVLTVPGTTAVSTDSVDVGIDAEGNATVSWEQAGVVNAAQLPAGGSLGVTQPIANGSQPVIAVGRSGRAVVAWIEGAGTAPVVRSAVRQGKTGAFGGVKTISATSAAFGISGVKATVGDNNAAAVVWSRLDSTGRTLVEVNDRAPGGTFADDGLAISDTTPAFSATHPAITIDPTGRETALWQDSTRQAVLYAERPPGGSWSSFDFASPNTESASSPVAAVAADGTVVAAWFVSNAGASIVQTAARAGGGGGFAGHVKLSGPSMDANAPIVAVGRRGHVLVAWTPSMGEAVYNRFRSATGSFGPVLAAASTQNQPAGEFRNFFGADAGVDDEGNAAAIWTRDAFRQSDAQNHYQMQFAGLDAAPPTFAAVSVPTAGRVGAGIGMAAAATDRWSPVNVRWSFGDGATASGAAVTHAFGGPGSFAVGVTARDAVGNASSTTRNVLVTRPSPSSTPRIDSTVQSNWGFDPRATTKFRLLRLKVIAPPKGSAAQLRCSGRGCPFQSRRVRKGRKRNITLYKNTAFAKAASKGRRFRAGQTVQLRITAPGFVGKVVDWRLKRGRLPVAKVRCLPPRAPKPRRC